MLFGNSWFGWNNRNSVPFLDEEEKIDEYLDTIKANLLRNQETIKSLRESVKKARDEAFAKTEMDKLREENEQLRKASYRGFPISEKESLSISEWRQEHDTKEHRNPKGYHGVSGGGYSYKFYPTAIGTSGVCVCSSCSNKAKTAALEAGDWKVYQKYMEEHNGEFEFQELG